MSPSAAELLEGGIPHCPSFRVGSFAVLQTACAQPKPCCLGYPETARENFWVLNAGFSDHGNSRHSWIAKSPTAGGRSPNRWLSGVCSNTCLCGLYMAENHVHCPVLALCLLLLSLAPRQPRTLCIQRGLRELSILALEGWTGTWCSVHRPRVLPLGTA